jgi:PAS fold
MQPASSLICAMTNRSSNCLRGYSSNSRLPCMSVTGTVLCCDRRAAELWGRSPKPGDPNERYCGSYQMFRPDGSLLPHHECPMADVLRTGISVREQEVHIERSDGVRGIALVDIEAIKDIDGNVVGAVNCFQDITERKRGEAQIVNLAHEAEHRTKNILSTVLATGAPFSFRYI